MARKELIEEREDGSKVYRETVVDRPKTTRQKRDAARAERILKDLEKNRQDPPPKTGPKARRKQQRKTQTLNKKRGKLGLPNAQNGPKQVSKEAAQLIQERKKLRGQGADLASRIIAQHVVDKAQ